ncbi:MAG TPA: Ldh family oxidoreductase [Chloroflexota bacterium]|nr:Ldh family oxidoreductase [Chloroflexota bacterium]
MTVLQAEQWRRVGRALFIAAGTTESNAMRVTEALVESSLAGHDSHGVIRFVQYTKAIEAGQLDPAAQPEVIKETACTSLVDGKWTFGQVGAEVCMKKAIGQARSNGIAISGLIRANHIGRVGEYSEMAYKAGMIGIVMVGGFASAGGAAANSGVAPFGGARPAFGTNPISFGLPAGEQPPVMVDFATSAVAGGKISLARAKGTSLPPNSILDKNGQPSTNPEDFYDGGMLLTFGGHKGYGLAVAIELLTQSLTGSDRFAGEKVLGGSYRKTGSTFIAVNPAVFRPSAEYASAADVTLKRIKDVPPAPGFDEVLIPGEPERLTRAQRIVEGISMPDSSWEELQKLAAKYKVDVTQLLA